MENKIPWETDMDKALSQAKSDNKFILLDFYNPG